MMRAGRAAAAAGFGVLALVLGAAAELWGAAPAGAASPVAASATASVTSSAAAPATVPVASPAAEIRALVLLVVLADPRPGAAEFPKPLVDEIAAELRRVYQVEVRILGSRPLPQSAYYAPRRRYKADLLLDHLAEQVPAGLPAATRVLGLTTADISTSKPPHRDWGVFGLGALGGTAAVVSDFRLRKKARDQAQVRWRVTNTAVHELGHVLGLDHCTEANCVMLDAQGGITNTDESNGVPGPQCVAKLNRDAPLRPAGVVRGAN